MEKKIASAIMLTLLLASMLKLTFNIQPVEANPATITVPGNYSTIQAAINAANAGDTIRVRNGSYTENVVVNKSVSIIGDGASITTVGANITSQPVFNVTANNAMISGFTITNASGTGSAGVYVEGNSSRVTENSVVGNFYGIYLDYSRGNNVSYNNVTLNLADGISLHNASNNHIDRNYNVSLNIANGIALESSTNNTISHNRYITNNTLNGIFLLYSSNNTISGNNIAKNSRYGIKLLNASSNNLISNNDVTSNLGHGISVTNSLNNAISYNDVMSNGVNPNLDYGINVERSSNTTVANNNVTANVGHGIYLGGTGIPDTCTVSENVVNSNGFMGVFLNSVWNSTVTDNNVTSNAVRGIYLDNEQWDQVSNNYVNSNVQVGIYLENCRFNSVFDNNVTFNGGAGVLQGGIVIVPTSNNNTIYNNYFNNTINARESGVKAGINNWNINKTSGINIIGGSWLGGNFWSDYKGVDLPPHDGIGDTKRPYNCSGRITVSAGDWLPLTTNRIPGYNLTVRVTTTLWQPLANANVTVDSTSFIYTRSKLTNTTGYAIFTNLPAGGYNMNATKTGYWTWGLWLNLTGNTNITLQMRAKPVAGFSIWPYLPMPGELVLFNASDSYDPDGIIIDYFWDFGDEIYEFGEIVEHIYGLPGYYNVTLTVTDNDGLNDTAWTILAVGVPVHDVATIDVTPLKTIVGKGCQLNINVTVENQGNTTETFNVTAYTNTTAIQTLTVANLPPGNSATIAFTWNTTGFTKGVYTISAYAWPVPNETDRTDNRFTDDTVRVTFLPGDISPDFGVIDIMDILVAAMAFGAEPGDENWNPIADLYLECGGDELIDIMDLLIIAIHFGETDP